MTSRILLVGCGNMGLAMLKGWLTPEKDYEIWVVDPTEGLLDMLAGAAVKVAPKASQLPEDFVPDLVFLAVKPQIMGKILPDFEKWSGGTATFVSIAAGLNTEFFDKALPKPSPIIRCMPNTPASVGAGAMVCYANDLVTQNAKNLCEKLLSSSGSVYFIEEQGLMDAVTAVSGSGPAYVFHFIEALSQAGESAGLPSKLAADLALQTVFGAVTLACQSGENPEQLRKNVTSAGGTTAAALDVLMQHNRLANTITEAVEAAKKRSLELSNI